MKKTYFFTKFILFVSLVLCLTFMIFPKSVNAKSIRVRKDGTGNFTTIQAAVDSAKSGDTIYIGAGTFVEPVTIVGKTLNLIGAGRGKSIITYPTPDYYKVPLYIQAGTVKNLTIIGHDGLKGYAVHIDNEYQYGRSLTFSNCRIVSNNAQLCVGIGTYGHNAISFNNCIFESNTRVIFYHNTVRPELAGPSSISLNKCQIKGSGDICITGINFETSDPVAVSQTKCINTFVTIPAPQSDETATESTETYEASSVPAISLPSISSVVEN